VYDLTKFTLRDMTLCGAALRTLGEAAQSLEDVASQITHYLYEHLRDQQTGERACALVRFYQTHPFGRLSTELQRFARRILSGQPASPDMRCLTLMATVGEKPAWNARETSVGHQAIPLPSPQIVAQVPMIANLIRQFGLEIHTVLQPDPQFLVELAQWSWRKRLIMCFMCLRRLAVPTSPHNRSLCCRSAFSPCWGSAACCLQEISLWSSCSRKSTSRARPRICSGRCR
jgi:hypothetical protein